LLEVEDLFKSFGEGAARTPVLRGVSMRVEAGESVALKGESGSGKSTLLHLIGLLDKPDAGGVALDGRMVSGLGDEERAAIRRQRIGLVFQQFKLIPSLTVGENIALQARLAKRHDRAFCARLTDRLGLSGLEGRYPEQLSGGQQQRVAIGRALAARPDIILADEPTGNLDEETGEAVAALMIDLVAETGAAMIVATHSAALAGRLGRTLHLEKGRLA
jgi:putative ABC transport system ATP-binding protein